MDIRNVNKKRIAEVLILFSLSILSFVVAYVLNSTLFVGIRESIVNAYFSLKTGEVEFIKIGEKGGIQRLEGDPLTTPSQDIVIVGIDDKTLSKLGRYPFSRDKHVEYILKPLAQSEEGTPKAVFFDIVFSEYSDEKIDKVFFDALSKSTNLFFDYMLIFDEVSEEGLDLENDKEAKERIKLLEKFTIPEENIRGGGYFLSARRGILPVREVIEPSKGVGFANVLPYSQYERSDTYNTVPMLIEFNGKFYPHIVLLLLCQYYDVPLSNVYVELGKSLTLKNAKIRYPDGSVIEKDVKIPIDYLNRFVINYTVRSDKVRIGGIRTISYSDVPRIKGVGKALDGKLVLIGMLSYGYGDVWKSPISPRMYGIEHIANALDNVIRYNIYGYPGYVKFVPEGVVIFLSFVLAIIIPFVIIGVRNLILGISIVLGLILVTGFSAFFIFSQGVQIFGKPILPYAFIFEITLPVSTILLSYISGQAYITLKERKERLQIKSMLDSYVSPEVVNILLKNPEKLNLGGEDRDVTIMFSDIRGFTSLSEGMSPQDLVSLINSYLSRMTDIIMENRGTVDKYIGDAIMAFWGAPLDDPEHPYRACKAALEMLEALKEINDTLPENRKIDIGIGINTGIATIGNMGSTKKKNYTAMGDTVNLASRLEGVNKVFHTRIIISEYTYERVKDRLLCRQLDVIRVKGKTIPVKIYEVIDFIDKFEDVAQKVGIDLKELQN
jgi:adenylate cyclase